MINSSWSILHTPQSPRSIKTTWGKKLRCVLINKRNLILLPTLVTFHSMSHCLQDVHITLGANKKSVLVCEDPFHTKRKMKHWISHHTVSYSLLLRKRKSHQCETFFFTRTKSSHHACVSDTRSTVFCLNSQVKSPNGYAGVTTERKQ